MISIKANLTEPEITQLMQNILMTHAHLGFIEVKTQTLLLLKEHNGDLYLSANVMPNGSWSLILKQNLTHLIPQATTTKVAAFS